MKSVGPFAKFAMRDSVSLMPRTLRTSSTVVVTVLAILTLGLVGMSPANAVTVSVWPSTPIPNVATVYAPTGEAFNGKFYVATVTDEAVEERQIQLSSTPLDAATPTWTTQSLVVAPDIGSSVAIKKWKSRLWMAFRGQDAKIYVTSSNDGVTWDAYTSMQGSVDLLTGDSYAGVALKGIDSKLYVVARDATGLVEVASRTEKGSWSAFKAVPGLTTNFRPAVTEFKDKLTIAIVSVDGFAYINSSSDGKKWSGYVAAPTFGMGGEDNVTPLVASAGPGLTVYNSKLHLAVRIGDFDTEDSMHIATFDSKKKWTTWNPTPPFGPTLSNEPYLTTADDDLFIVSQGFDDSTAFVERR